jgi:anthranilate/para-aminobenzoate synthase component I
MYARALPGPISLPLEAARLRGQPGLAWLDGEADHAEGRWSFLGVQPCETVRVFGGDPAPLSAFDRIAPPAMAEPGASDGVGVAQGVPRTPSPLAAASAAGPVVADWPPGAPTPAEVPRWIGYVAYDAYRGARLAPERTALCFARYRALLCVRHRDGAAFVVGDDEAACEQLLSLRAQAARAQQQQGLPGARVRGLEVTPASQHLRAIRVALEHIAAGDVYQVNLARRWQGHFEGEPLALGLALRAASPVPLGFYMEDGQRTVLARTMERFLRWETAGGSLLTRPIKGTIARAGGRDLQEARALRDDAKERAEHAMIVDLMRNDLGRVAQLGSVRVGPVMEVEPFAGLSHLVSTVRCRVAPGLGARAIMEATFPPGSITGTPKLRAIDVIDALEASARDVYTGAVGFVDRAGGLSLAVAIRSTVVERDTVRYWAGGGIVEASDPQRELAETELKARVFVDALRKLDRGGTAQLLRARSVPI